MPEPWRVGTRGATQKSDAQYGLWKQFGGVGSREYVGTDDVIPATATTAERRRPSLSPIQIPRFSLPSHLTSSSLSTAGIVV